MKKVKRFVVLYVTFCTNEKLSMPIIFSGLNKLGVKVAKIQWKNRNCLKLRVWIDPPGQIGQKQASREEAVSAAVNKTQVYFQNATVVATYGKDNR